MPVIQTGDNLKKLTAEERLGQNRESEYLGAEDIDPGTEPILTIDALYNGMVTLQRGKENKDVITFKEKSVNGLKNVRPLIVNATNRKTLRKIYGGVQSKTLEGKQIQLYIDHKVRDPQDGSLTDGIRIRPFKPKPPIQIPPCSSCGGEIKPAAGKTAEWMLAYTVKTYGKALCAECAAKEKAAKMAAEEAETAEHTTSTVNPDTGEVQEDIEHDTNS